MIIRAFIIAMQAHKGQKDKGGKPYILHPVKVATMVKGTKCKTVALLHDIVEDTNVSLGLLKKRGFDNDVIEAVEAITKRTNEQYNDYIRRVKNNDIARNVKIADLKHNSNIKRLKTITNDDVKRICKYIRAEKYLEG